MAARLIFAARQEKVREIETRSGYSDPHLSHADGRPRNAFEAHARELRLQPVHPQGAHAGLFAHNSYYSIC
jgi:hypothetical protein